MIPPPTRVIYRILGQKYLEHCEFRAKSKTIAKGTFNFLVNVTQETEHEKNYVTKHNECAGANDAPTDS